MLPFIFYTIFYTNFLYLFSPVPLTWMNPTALIYKNGKGLIFFKGKNNTQAPSD